MFYAFCPMPSPCMQDNLHPTHRGLVFLNELDHNSFYNLRNMVLAAPPYIFGTVGAYMHGVWRYMSNYDQQLLLEALFGEVPISTIQCPNIRQVRVQCKLFTPSATITNMHKHNLVWIVW